MWTRAVLHSCVEKTVVHVSDDGGCVRHTGSSLGTPGFGRLRTRCKPLRQQWDAEPSRMMIKKYPPSALPPVIRSSSRIRTLPSSRQERIFEHFVRTQPREQLKLIRKTLTSHQKDNVKSEDDMTTSSRTQDTVGGRPGIFLNTYGDVPMSILQQRHTANTQQQRQLPLPTRPQPQHSKGIKKEQQQQKKRRIITLRCLLTSHRKMQDA